MGTLSTVVARGHYSPAEPLEVNAEEAALLIIFSRMRPEARELMRRLAREMVEGNRLGAAVAGGAP